MEQDGVLMRALAREKRDQSAYLKIIYSMKLKKTKDVEVTANVMGSVVVKRADVRV